MNPVVASGLSVALNGHRVIDSVDLTLEEGRFVALLGPNGSGKTTLVKALLGVIPAVGDLRLFGVPLRAFRAWERIGYVPQRFGAATGVPATVEEVAASGRLARTGVWRRWNDDDRAALRDALGAAGVQDLARRPVEELSGGQQQRVLIARALASEPELLVLDEPVSSVDLESQQIFAAALGDLKRAGRTVLVVAHALGALKELVDRTVVLEQGRIAYDGPPRLEHTGERHDDHHPPIPDPGPFDRALGGP